jgi:hypothetical protein
MDQNSNDIINEHNNLVEYIKSRTEECRVQWENAVEIGHFRHERKEFGQYLAFKSLLDGLKNNYFKKNENSKNIKGVV